MTAVITSARSATIRPRRLLRLPPVPVIQSRDVRAALRPACTPVSDEKLYHRVTQWLADHWHAPGRLAHSASMVRAGRALGQAKLAISSPNINYHCSSTIHGLRLSPGVGMEKALHGTAAAAATSRAGYAGTAWALLGACRRPAYLLSRERPAASWSAAGAAWTSARSFSNRDALPRPFAGRRS